ncbi:expansin EXLX1 family cellulose-binding protein [Nocardia suismassiliense]|uniref:Expansin EXLX1 family cellulose-binding protein n=1 Tax=Nocardia suismassiliense TaxID=2077092 RepID=A0ABW6R611_9NOCA
MHRIPINQRHVRSGWLWSAIGLVAIAGAAVWLTRPDPLHCETPSALTQTSTARMPVDNSGFTPITAPVTNPQPVVSGEARFYSFSQGVSCSFAGLPLDGFYVGMSTPEFGRADPCGAYLDIQGPRGDVRALIVDRCPACAPGQLDLSVAAFAQLADLSDGVVPIRYNVVHNPEPPPELSYQVKPDSSSAWFAMLVSGAGNPLQDIAIRHVLGGDWRPLTRGMDNYWTISGAGAGPFVARVTDVHGNQAEIYDIDLEPGVHPTGTRLYSGTPPVAAPVTMPPPITSPTTLAAAPQQPSSSMVSAACRP